MKTAPLSLQSLALLLLLPALTMAAPGSKKGVDLLANRPPHVVVISIDQGAPAGIAKAEMPVLKAMAAEGARTWRAFTIVPSLTLPSHVSMVTGVGVQAHQVSWNTDAPERGPLAVPTMFALAKTTRPPVGRADGGRTPLHGKLTTALFSSKAKFALLNQPGSLDVCFVEEAAPTAKIAAEAVRHFAGLTPGESSLTLVHFGEPDRAGHAHGSFSPEKMRALADVDAAIGQIRDALKAAQLLDSSVLIVTADHGSHDEDKGHGLRGTHGSSDPADVEIPWIAWGARVAKNKEITAAVVTYDTAATALWLLGAPLPESLWGRPVQSAFAADAGAGR